MASQAATHGITVDRTYFAICADCLAVLHELNVISDEEGWEFSAGDAEAYGTVCCIHAALQHMHDCDDDGLLDEYLSGWHPTHD